MEVVRIIQNTVKNYFFIFSLLLLVISLPLTESLLSISSGLLCLQLFFTGNFKEKIAILKTDKALWAFMGVFFIYLFGCIFCNDIKTGLYELQKNLFWILIPLGVALSKKLNKNEFWFIISIFVLTVTVASVFTSVKIVFDGHFEINDFRDASFVSHVSFALQIVFSIMLLLYSAIKKTPFIGQLNPLIIGIWCLWLVVFMGFQKSLIGFISLYGSGIVFIFWLITRIKSLKYKKYTYALMIIFLVFPILYVSHSVLKFYNLPEKEPNIKALTESGKPFSFNLNSKLKENSAYVYWYINNEELEQEWNKVSDIKLFDYDDNGYQIYHTLVRYMTSLGLKKDSAGVAALNENDIRNIQDGISNHIFVTRKYSIYPRVYQTIWELDKYYHTGNPNHQSLSQRIEFARAALHLIGDNFFGVGTGNYIMAYKEAYSEIDTQLSDQLKFQAHNQYLSYMVKFGLPGFLLILFLIGYPIIHKKQHRNILVIIMLAIIGLACMGETTLETHIGLPFFLLFVSLMLWHLPKPQRDF